MLYLAWDREINISLFFATFLYENEGPRPRTSSRCYHGNKSTATFKKGIFVHPPWVPNCMQNLKGGWKFLFPKFDSYRDLFLTERLGYPLERYQSFLGQGILLLAHRIHTHLCSAVNTTFVFHQVFIVFNSRVI